MAKMNPGFQQFCDGYVCQCVLHSCISPPRHPMSEICRRDIPPRGQDFGSMFLCPKLTSTGRYCPDTGYRDENAVLYSSPRPLQVKKRPR
jgi:hypothetical protein